MDCSRCGTRGGVWVDPDGLLCVVCMAEDRRRGRIAQAALAIALSDHVRQNAFGDYLLDYVDSRGYVEARWLEADDIAPMLWAIAESEVSDAVDPGWQESRGPCHRTHAGI